MLKMGGPLHEALQYKLRFVTNKMKNNGGHKWLKIENFFKKEYDACVDIPTCNVT